VLKNKDIAAYLTDEERERLDDICRKINHGRLLDGKDTIQCVVVEHDWPEYEEVWAMLEARVHLLEMFG
jgi:hypothetical protein